MQKRNGNDMGNAIDFEERFDRIERAILKLSKKIDECLSKEPKSKKEDDLMDIDEAKVLLHVGYSAFYEWVKKGLITRYRIPGTKKNYYKKSEILSLLKPVEDE